MLRRQEQKLATRTLRISNKPVQDSDKSLQQSYFEPKCREAIDKCGCVGPPILGERCSAGIGVEARIVTLGSLDETGRSTPRTPPVGWHGALKGTRRILRPSGLLLATGSPSRHLQAADSRR